MPNSPQDVHKKVLGKKGENAAEKFLKKQKCKILERNYRTPFGEVDLIVSEKDEIAFVEVKTRQSTAFGEPKEAVNEQKQARYRQMAKFYAVKLGEEPNLRFDVIEVFDGEKIEWYKHAF